MERQPYRYGGRSGTLHLLLGVSGAIGGARSRSGTGRIAVFCGASGQVRKGDGVHVIAETQHVVSRVKDNSGESVHIELCTKPFMDNAIA